MKANFVVFHTGTGRAQTLVTSDRKPPEYDFELFKTIMRSGRAALHKTCGEESNYIVLTDKETAPFLENEFDIRVCAPSDVPLMRQYVAAQAAYMGNKPETGLTVLAATDCCPGRNLEGSCPYPLGITYRLRGHGHINNIAYVNDHDLGAWFLRRALSFMPENPGWFADQESWYAALGPFSTWEKLDPDGYSHSTRYVVVNGRTIHLLPCHSHNYFIKGSGIPNMSLNAWVFHYKGVKTKMEASIAHYILGTGTDLPRKSELRRMKKRNRKK